MHRHITYYTQSTVCQGGFSNKFLSSTYCSSWAYAGFAKRGQLLFFFGGGGLATRGVATRLLGGSGACFTEKKKFNGAIWCVLEYIFIIFLLSKSLKISFLVVFSFFEKTTYCCRARRLSVRPSVCLSVCPSVEIISFRGNSLSNWPIELKIGLNVREGVVHVR